MEKHLDKDPSICILALVLDTEKSVYVGHYYAKVGSEELPLIILTFERQNSTLIFCKHQKICISKPEKAYYLEQKFYFEYS